MSHFFLVDRALARLKMLLCTESDVMGEFEIQTEILSRGTQASEPVELAWEEGVGATAAGCVGVWRRRGMFHALLRVRSLGPGCRNRGSWLTHGVHGVLVVSAQQAAEPEQVHLRQGPGWV